MKACIIVCTRNRNRQLIRAVESAVQQSLDAPWEVLVVDNDSTDDTYEVAGELAQQHERVRCVRERRLGLSAARNRGLAESTAEIAVFLDDDAYPEEGWLQRIVDAFDDPSVACAGGAVRPVFDAPYPAWFTARYLPYLSSWKPGPDALQLYYNEYPRGANIAYRTSILEEVGRFSEALGRKGSRLLSGEETDLCLRIERSGYRVLYVPDAEVLHEVSIERMTPDWMRRRFFSQGETEALVHWAHGGPRALLETVPQLVGNVLASRRESLQDGGVFRSCQVQVLLGFVKGSFLAPFSAPKVRLPRKESRPFRVRERRPPAPVGRPQEG